MKKTLLSAVFFLAALTCVNAQSVTYTNELLEIEDLSGYNIYPNGSLTGTLTAIEISATKVSGTMDAGELAIYITPTSAFGMNGLVYAGGTDNWINATDWQPWPVNDGTNISGTITLATPIDFPAGTTNFVRIVNLSDFTGEWSDITVTFYGVSEVCGAAGNCTWDMITNVNFAGIDNTTGCGVGFTNYNMTADVEIGSTYTLSVTAESEPFSSLFAFIDWNGNGVLDDDGEVYALGSWTTAPGLQTLTQDIEVPASAEIGEIEMRVFLVWSETELTDLDPCAAVAYGEVENYKVNVQSSASISDFSSSFSVYPNPAKDVLNISNSIGAEINTITVSDINGRTVKQFGSVSQINISDLNAGVYFVNISSNEGSLTKKVVKQ